MTTSPYFNHIHNELEQDLQESLVVENIQLFGQDIYYIPLDDFDVDPILMEPKNVRFQKYHVIEAYLPDNGEPGGERNIMSKFGFKIAESIEILIAKKRFHEELPDRLRPLEGDLVFIGDPQKPRDGYVNTYFEVNQVSYQTPEWPFGDHYTYRLYCEIYTYNFDKIETGLEVIDAIDMSGPENAAKRDEFIETRASNSQVKDEKADLIQFDRKNPLTGI